MRSTVLSNKKCGKKKETDGKFLKKGPTRPRAPTPTSAG